MTIKEQMAAMMSLGLPTEIMRLVALSYLFFWHFGIQMFLMNAIWWHMLNPVNLAIDPTALAILFGACYICPLLLDIPVFARMLVNIWWAVLGPIPAVFIALTAIPHDRTRTAMAALATACGTVGLAYCCSTSGRSAVSRCTPWALTLGVLGVQLVKYSWGSVNPFLDRHYTMPHAYGFLGFQLTGCILAAVAGFVLRRAAVVIEQPAEGEGGADEEEGTCCNKKCFTDRRAWLWAAVGPVLALAIVNLHTILNNPGSTPKLVGMDPFPAGIAMPFSLAIGALLSYVLAQGGVALPIGALVLNFLGAVLLYGDSSCTGKDACGGFQTIAGGIFLGLAEPCLFLTIITQVNRLKVAIPTGCYHIGTAARTFAFAGFLIFLDIFMYLSSVFNNVNAMNGQMSIWYNVFVGMPAYIGLVAIIVLHFYDRRGKAAFTRTEIGEALDAPVKTGFGPAPLAAFFVLLIFIIVLFPACFGYRASRVPIATWPATGDKKKIKVMAFNVMQGYTTKGSWNGECVADAIRKSAPDHVSVPEAEAMRAYTGNRGIVDFMSTELRMFFDFGPPSWSGGAGIATLTSRAPYKETWEMLPTADPKSGLNRFIIHTQHLVSGLVVHVLSIHTEWFGDPTMQVGFIAAKAKNLKGPVIVLGDFNLEPNGASNNNPNGTGLAPMTAAGFESVTPLGCVNSTMKPKGHICRSSMATTLADAECYGPVDCDGYQLDYIFYTPYWLDVVPGSVKTTDIKVDDVTYCSDHMPIEAIFSLTPAAVNAAKAT